MSQLPPVWRTQIKSAVEMIGLVAPIVCLFDCIALPALPIFLPLVNLHSVIHGISDQVLTFVVLALCCQAIIPGFLRHRSWKVLLLFGLAASLMLFVNMVSFALDQLFHTVLTVAASGLLIKANLDNRKLLAYSCACSKSDSSSQ